MSSSKKENSISLIKFLNVYYGINKVNSNIKHCDVKILFPYIKRTSHKITNKNLIYVGQVLKLPSDAIYFDKYIGSSSSLVDSLKSLGEKSDYTYRTKIALTNGIINYAGTQTQNIYLLNLLKEWILVKE